ncbi:MAG: accessory gene regulator B family protein [Roseburia sp.]|nr:accessory gene regulator B family protein [Roseburia sp.]MCM1243893.1 accessory gene regulator B family protein [Roseburia sp.]
MQHVLDRLQKEYGFSDYQIRLLRFTFTGILYDLSKTLIFGIYFCVTGRFAEFLFALVPLILLRIRSGGIHFRKYRTCLFFSFLYLCLAIHVLPGLIPVHPLAAYPVLLVCAVADYLAGPNTVKEKVIIQDAVMKNEQGGRIKKAKIECFQVVLIVAVLYFLFPQNQYLIVSFWTVVLHTVQLVITKIMREVKYHEELA